MQIRQNKFRNTLHAVLLLPCFTKIQASRLTLGSADITAVSILDNYIFWGLLVGAVLVGLLAFIVLAKRMVPRKSDSFDTDIRLTYKRYMELYPYSPITYAEYKKLQSEKAFRKPTEIRKMKRMVR